METTLTSTAGLIPMMLSLVGVLVALQYLKGMAEFSEAVRFIFWGFVFVFFTKVLIFAAHFMSAEHYYFASLLFHLWSAVLLMAGAASIRGSKFFNRNVVISACLLAGVWSWYVVIITRDGTSLTVSLASSVAGYAFLAASLWRRKMLRNSIGFVITGWFSVFLALYNLLMLMSWGQSLLSPAFETFLYIAVMCGWILISNNLMAHQFDTLEQEAEESKERLRLMIQMSPFPIIISRLKDDQLMLINNKAGALFGLDVKHPGNFKTVDYFAEPSKRTELLAKLEKHPVVDDFEFLVKPRKGDPFWLLLSARVIDFEYEIALYMAFQDITDRKKKELQLFDQATRDPLTKCYNRRQFDELAKNEVQRSRRYNHPFCLFMIDADHFKNVNDTHGHAVGDLVLQALADCCRRTLRESDIVARFGGEEFVILLPEATVENAHRVAERLRIKISKLVVKNEQNQDVQFTVSIGLVSSTVTDDIPEMLKMADESLYVAKENGRNQVVVYEADGPNKDLPHPDGEDIEKAKAEPLYYFKPSVAPVIMNHSDEPVETGVVGLSGDVADEEEYLDDDEEEQPTTGVSLNSLYEEEEDTSFVPTNKPVAPPIAVAPPVFEPENETPLEAELPPETGFLLSDIDTGFSAEELQGLPPEESDLPEELPPEEFPDLPAQNDILPPETEMLPDNETDQETELPLEEEDFPVPETPLEEELYPDQEEIGEEPPLEEDISFVQDGNSSVEIPAQDFPLPVGEEEEFSGDHQEQEDLPPIEEPAPAAEEFLEPTPPAVAEYSVPEEGFPELSVSENEESEFSGFMPPPIAPAPEPIQEMPAQPLPVAPVVKAPMIKMPVMKKIPIKMPPGMVKVPKMPGIVRVKIPKALHQSEPVSPKPSGQE
ncbi:MAG: diguanylate cyclase [Alphaproteobacteria bacterium]|nr:diguanylate cyclase [Alphaproteobacteria bacterium]